MSNASEYQKYIADDHIVTEEAPKFLQEGYFFAPMGNTMVLAVSNALDIPVVIFSSANHYPIINVTPRVCKVPVPLFVAFNQAGAGHYDAIAFKGDQHALLKNTDGKQCNCRKDLSPGHFQQQSDVLY